MSDKNYYISKLKKQLQVIHEYLNKYHKENGLYTELCVMKIGCIYSVAVEDSFTKLHYAQYRQLWE